ncbi:MAG: type II toxin-antitoxin system PemK/MazF family toxin [Bacilli bacterium]
MVKDIILIENYKSQNSSINKHSFIVLTDECGEIRGLPYDLICNVMSSFKSEEQKRKKLKYAGNFPITAQDTLVIYGNRKPGYIKADQLYYFKKSKISYRVIGKINDDVYKQLLEHIASLDSFEDIIDNL